MVFLCLPPHLSPPPAKVSVQVFSVWASVKHLDVDLSSVLCEQEKKGCDFKTEYAKGRSRNRVLQVSLKPPRTHFGAYSADRE